MVFAASPSVNVAIISPTAIYGLSPSIEHPVPLTLPGILNTISRVPGGFIVSAVKISKTTSMSSLWHVYLLLVSYAIDAKESEAGLDLWGLKAYYFGAVEELAFADFMAALVSVLNKKGIVQNETLTSINVADAAKVHLGGDSQEAPPLDSWAVHIAIMYGTDMRVRSTRAKKIDWQPRGPAVKDTLDEVVERYLAEKKS
jgi:hypothetical protein